MRELLNLLKSRFPTLLALACIVPLGFYSKFYRGPLHWWVNNSLGGFFYVVFWCLVVFIFVPNVRPFRIAAAVFLLSSVIEILQLWRPPFLQAVRSTFIGVTLIGNTFVWSDVLYYALGSVFSLILMHVMRRAGK